MESPAEIPTAAHALRVMAHINRGQAARASHPIMRTYHEECAADYEAAAARMVSEVMSHESRVMSEEQSEAYPPINP